MEHPLLSRLRATRPDRRRTIAALAAVVAAAAGGVVALTLGSATAEDGGAVDAGVGRCTTGADGTCLIEHHLGRAPDAVVVTLSAPVSGADALPYQLATDQFTEQHFRLRARTTTGAVYQGEVT